MADRAPLRSTGNSPVSSARTRKTYGAFHAADIIYVFNNLSRSPYPYANRNFDDTDQRVSDLMASYWVNFAVTGNPNGEGLPEWPVYTEAADEALEFGDDVTVRADIRKSKSGLDFFDRYYAAQRAARPKPTSDGRGACRCSCSVTVITSACRVL